MAAIGEQVQCPVCLGMIPEEARACMYCGERFNRPDPSIVPPTSPAESTATAVNVIAVIMIVVVGLAVFAAVLTMMNNASAVP